MGEQKKENENIGSRLKKKGGGDPTLEKSQAMHFDIYLQQINF